MSENLSWPLVVETRKDFDPWLNFIQIGATAMHYARYMRKFANHHSGVEVGSIVYATSDEGYFGLFPSANQNLRKGPNDTKACAEEVSLMKVRNYGFNRVLGLFTSGTVQPDSISEIESDTLHTCNVERGHFLDLWQDGVIEPHTKVVTVHPEKDIWEIYDAFGLIDLHHRRATDKLQSFDDPGFTQWQAGERYYLRETDKELSLGIEPDQPRIAHQAVIGHYALTA